MEPGLEVEDLFKVFVHCSVFCVFPCFARLVKGCDAPKPRTTQKNA